MIKTGENIGKRKQLDRVFHAIIFVATLVGIIFLIVLLWKIFKEGLPWLNVKFLLSYPSRFPERAGIYSAIVGTLWTISLTALIAFPLGIATAIYLEEYSRKDSWYNRLLQLNILNLAGVPSIVYGILGLGLFVKLFSLGRSILAASLTLALLILPVIIVSSQEALRTVPKTLREASYALGATRWQTVSRVVVPAALPTIFTGTILALSRAIGEAAPLIMVGAAAYMPFLPKSIFDNFTTLPIQIFNWTSRPQKEFQGLAAAGIIVLLAILLSANALAIILRDKTRKV
ncbi:phosphate ABC transporter membrane protein 2, PhoT family [Carboxydothermus islandicus]|uniref:Phosphate transport system permease protein PstA n=1 Tax=Carboxydothermus islandicus TaxID=661089 RepID=A0A1L8D1B0_9THEO|nr:phosphate ABC transporter permease PstA [Carboxydothermus islandicus]GAV24929.1 phosphate ABC transporter membrane protein 2, PhoT family [Carboxydothermus islandicus]